MEKEIKKRKITSIEISYSNKRELKELSNKIKDTLNAFTISF